MIPNLLVVAYTLQSTIINVKVITLAVSSGHKASQIELVTVWILTTTNLDGDYGPILKLKLDHRCLLSIKIKQL